MIKIIIFTIFVLILYILMNVLIKDKFNNKLDLVDQFNLNDKSRGNEREKKLFEWLWHEWWDWIRPWWRHR